MGKQPDSLKISSDSALLQIRSLTMSGDYYRVVLGRKELVTTEYLERPEHTGNMVLYTEERFAGEKDTRYTLNEITVSPITRKQLKDHPSDGDALTRNENNDQPSNLNQPFESDFSFNEFGNYQMKGFVFNYQIVPTLNKGPKLTKSFVTPTNLFTVKGYLADHIKTPNIIPPPPPEKDSDVGDIGDNPIPSNPVPIRSNGIPQNLNTGLIPNASSLRKTITQDMEHHISI